MSSMYRALSVLAAAVVGACAQQPAPAIRFAGDTESVALLGNEGNEGNEARALEAARRHPNAQPRVRPEYPEQSPPPLPAGKSLPAPLHITRRSTPYADAPAPSNVLVERTVYEDSPYRYRPWYGYGYGYGYSYRRPWGVSVGLGWDPYGYGYGSYYSPRVRYGYGYGVGLGFSAPLWGARHLHYPSYGRVHRLGWDGARHHGWGFGSGRGGGGHVRWVSGRRR